MNSRKRRARLAAFGLLLAGLLLATAFSWRPSETGPATILPPATWTPAVVTAQATALLYPPRAYLPAVFAP